MALSISDYISSKGEQRGNLPETLKIDVYIPNPSENDYSVGYIERYFVQKTNDINSFIYEVSEHFKQTIMSNPLYSITKIKWKITGTPQQIMDANKKSIDYVVDNIPKLKAYLPNLLQFAKIN
jgi:hypothetical protein